MKKLLMLIIVFWAFNPQTIRGQCPQPYEMSRIPDYKAFFNSDADLTFSNYMTAAVIKKELVLPNGDLIVAGDFDKICQYDGTNTGILQTLAGLHGLAQRDAITGVWTAIPTAGANYPYQIWYLDGSLYATMDPYGVRKFDTGTNTWSAILFPYIVSNIISAGSPFEYYVAFHAPYPQMVGDFVGLRRWNTQTGDMTVIAGSTLPDATSGYTINETQTSDTLVVIFHDLFTSPMILIKGQLSLIQLDIPSIAVESPHSGYSPGFSFGWVNDVIFLPNDNIYAVVTRAMPDMTALMKWNLSIQKWDSIDSRVGFTNSDIDVFFYDPGSNTLNAEALGVVNLQNLEFTEAHVILGYPYAVPTLRQGNKWYNGGALLKDTIAPTAPNTTVANNITQLLAGQTVIFTASNAHEGALAKRYKDNVLVDSLNIDTSNCSNFVFSDIVQAGVQTYIFTLTDPSGNESLPTSIIVEGFWPTSVNDIDKDFATFFTNGKTLFIKGDVKKVEVYDLNSKVIFSQTVNSSEFTQSFDYLPSGMYILKASNADGKMMIKKLLLN